MSMMLRKRYQRILDDVNLSNYHATIGRNRALTIVKECGQPLLEIHGIRFDNTIPKEEEIDFGEELLEAFFVQHKPDIDTLLRLQQELKYWNLI